jgi:hypothetical protein
LFDFYTVYLHCTNLGSSKSGIHPPNHRDFQSQIKGTHTINRNRQCSLGDQNQVKCSNRNVYVYSKRNLYCFGRNHIHHFSSKDTERDLFRYHLHHNPARQSISRRFLVSVELSISLPRHPNLKLTKLKTYIQRVI